MRAGVLRERLTLLTKAPIAVSVSGLTRAGATATVTAAAHGFTTGAYVEHAGAVQTEYNVEAKITVVDATTYTFAVAGTPASPATGIITATFRSDSAGGQAPDFVAVTTVWGEVRALSASEQMRARAIGAQHAYEGRIRYRADVVPAMRVAWTPYGFTTAKTLEIHGVRAEPRDPRGELVLDLGEVL